MIVRDHGKGGRWFVEARSYATALQAKRAWERAERKLDLSAGDEGIGLMRLAPNPDGGRPTGAPASGHSVVLVTLDEATARKAQRLLRDGVVWDPTPGFADTVIARRARVVLAHEGETGRLLIRRPEGRGGQLGPDGIIVEQVGGDE